jgi:hypothetical protein
MLFSICRNGAAFVPSLSSSSSSIGGASSLRGVDVVSPSVRVEKISCEIQFKTHRGGIYLWPLIDFAVELQAVMKHA